jgi:hypothetical protein
MIALRGLQCLPIKRYAVRALISWCGGLPDKRRFRKSEAGIAENRLFENGDTAKFERS